MSEQHASTMDAQEDATAPTGLQVELTAYQRPNECAYCKQTTPAATLCLTLTEADDEPDYMLILHVRCAMRLVENLIDGIEASATVPLVALPDTGPLETPAALP